MIAATGTNHRVDVTQRDGGFGVASADPWGLGRTDYLPARAAAGWARRSADAVVPAGERWTGRGEAARMLVVDAANVIGAVPDGWWRDRPGAAVRLHTRLQSAMAAGLLGNERVVLVLEGAARAGVPCGADGDLEVRHAPRDADEEVRRLVAATPGAVRVVTADRRLAADCVAAGARVLGPRWLLDRLP